jgi:uncharacterized protein YdbL (DUF1318 family)
MGDTSTAGMIPNWKIVEQQLGATMDGKVNALKGDKELRVLATRRDEERACSLKNCAAATRINAAERKTHCWKTKCDAAEDMAKSVGDVHGRRR